MARVFEGKKIILKDFDKMQMLLQQNIFLAQVTTITVQIVLIPKTVFYQYLVNLIQVRILFLEF